MTKGCRWAKQAFTTSTGAALDRLANLQTWQQSCPEIRWYTKWSLQYSQSCGSRKARPVS